MAKKMMVKLWCGVNSLRKDEKGDLKDLVWVLGAGVVMVLVVVVFMTLAPDTAESMWNSFIDYATDAFGL